MRKQFGVTRTFCGFAKVDGCPVYRLFQAPGGVSAYQRTDGKNIHPSDVASSLSEIWSILIHEKSNQFVVWRHFVSELISLYKASFPSVATTHAAFTATEASTFYDIMKGFQDSFSYIETQLAYPAPADLAATSGTALTETADYVLLEWEVVEGNTGEGATTLVNYNIYRDVVLIKELGATFDEFVDDNDGVGLTGGDGHTYFLSSVNSFGIEGPGCTGVLGTADHA